MPVLRRPVEYDQGLRAQSVARCEVEARRHEHRGDASD